MKPEVIKVRDDEQVREAARTAARALAEGKLVILPTETVYGVAACVGRPEALARLREMKGRPAGSKPFTVHIPDKRHVKRYVNRVPHAAERIIRKGWPGPLTLVLPVAEPAKSHIARVVSAEDLRDIFHEDTVGLRCPDHPVASAAFKAVRYPVVATSANRPGESPPIAAEAAAEELGDHVDLVIDAGLTRYAKPSTVVQIGQDGSWKMLRSGVLDEHAVGRLVRTTILFVCSGNTCRSPMAEGLCKLLLGEKLGCEPSRLRERNYEVFSAGTSAAEGLPPSAEAVEACRQRGIDISNHRSRRLTADLIRQADYVFTMCDHHTEAVVKMVRQAKNRVGRLDPKGDIPDPAGASRQQYLDSLQRIRAALEARLQEII